MAGGRRWIDVALTLLAAAYFVAIAVWNFGPSVYASVDDVEDGRVWLLVTSALEVDGRRPLLQVGLTALVAACVIVREGPRLWWSAALSAHVASALVAYGVIGIATGLGSDSAERVADDPDYGVSCVLAGSLGALLVSGLLGMRAGSVVHGARADRVAVAAGAVGLLGLLTVTFGWYDMEHPLAFAVGAIVTWVLRRHAVRNPQHRASPSV
jgi:hypothetical protein